MLKLSTRRKLKKTMDAQVLQDDDEDVKGKYPAYPSTSAAAAEVPSKYNHHCAGHDEFCFFCEYDRTEACPDEAEEDLRADLAQYASSMISNKRELVTIARNIQKAYRTQVRNYVVYSPPDGSPDIPKPDWSLESIERHLMFSTEFRGVFHDYVERNFHSMLVRVGDTAITEEGAVCETRAKQWTSLIKAYTDFRKFNAEPRPRKRPQSMMN